MAALDKVGFIVAGAQKGGTSALDNYLREHTELCLPQEKELHFFDTDRCFAVEPVDYAPYHAYFSPGPAHRLMGEVTPAYLYWPTAVERIARYNPAMRLIVVLRNPVTRAFSHWNMSRRTGREPLPFRQAIEAEEQRLRGFYTRQLNRLWRYFPRQQTIVFKSEELLREHTTVLARVADFLDIAPFPPLAEKRAEVREYETVMSDEERRYLGAVFETEIGELERLLGWDCAAWRV